MRTTISPEDEANPGAEVSARARALGLGQAVSELVRLGSANRLRFKQVGGVWVFDLPPQTPVTAAIEVQALLDEQP